MLNRTVVDYDITSNKKKTCYINTRIVICIMILITSETSHGKVSIRRQQDKRCINRPGIKNWHRCKYLWVIHR